MSDPFAITNVFDAVAAHFVAVAAAAGGDPPRVPVPVVFGWRQRSKKPTRATTAENAGTARRIVWCPGDDSNGDLGELGPPRFPGREPRSLGTLNELVTVYLEANDLSAPEDERAQYVAARELYDEWMRAMYAAARTTFAIVREGWVIEQNERRAGAAIRIVMTLEAMLPATQRGEAVVGLNRAEWVATELDHSETGSAELEEEDETP